MDSLYVAWQLTALGSSLLAGGGMCYFFYKYPRARVHPGPVLMCILVSLTVTNATRVALLTLQGSDSDNESDSLRPGTLSDIANLELSGRVDEPMRAYIPFFFWCSYFFYTSATLWYLMLALDLIFSLSNPFLPFNADNVKHHVYAWPASLLWCAIFRYVFENASGEQSVHVLLYYNLPAYAVLLYVTGALVLAWRRSRRLETHAHETTRMMAKLILPYLALFAMDVSVTIILYVAEVAMGNQTATSSALDQLALVIEMLGVFVLFCRDAGVFSAMHSDSDSRASVVNLHMQRASAFNTQQLQQIQLQSTPPPPSSGEPTGKIDVPNKLRMDVMKYMSMGIQESIRQARIAEEDACARCVSRPTSATDPSGFRATDTSGDVQFDDYNQVKSFGVLVFGQKGHNSVLSFRDCAPKVFASIRDHFHIDWESYLESFDPAKILSEHGSEGKSGNIFYFTANKQFMVKSVPKEEFDTLRAILPHYHRYLLSNPQTMLCRYFGCHSISLPIGTRRMYFVVMQNLFNEGPVDQRFDLKGNLDQRQAVTASQVENLIQKTRDQQPISQLMLDIDFRKLSAGISLSYPSAALVQGQLCDDVVFLASRGIIDYSILLGVSYLKSGERLPSMAAQSQGIYSNDLDKMYYVGIVDMLQRYNWRWTLQRWLLGVLLCKDTHDVSAVPPEEYGTRLTTFVRSRLFDIQGSGNEGDHFSTPHSSSSNAPGSQKLQQKPYTAVGIDMDPRASSEAARELSMSSLDSQSLLFASVSSSPSVAYSSSESPMSRRTSEGARSSTFFV